MTLGPLVAALVIVGSTSTASGGSSRSTVEACRSERPGSGYAHRVETALRARTDVWGNAVLRTRRGPTYEGVRSYLAPLFLARGPKGRRLTESGVHYVAFTHPAGPGGSGSAALHVADGSQILSLRVGGRSLTIGVGRGGRERYGSCLSRTAPPRLADGYLPILETRYVDAAGARYEQESFAVRPSEGAPLTSFVRVVADGTHARGVTGIRLMPGDSTFVVPAQASTTIFVSWSHLPSEERPSQIDRATYDLARATVVAYWGERLSQGATIDVPERRARDAARNLLLQNLGLGWRYSIGNPYQQFSYPEALDVAQVMSAYGFTDVAGAVLRRSLSTPRGPYPHWRLGQKLVATAAYFRVSGDREVIAAMTPELRRGVVALGRELAVGDRDILRRERYSSDIPDLVYGLHAQTVVWQGLREMGTVWFDAGKRELAGRCRRLAARLEAGLRRAVRVSSTRLADGTLFVPVRLLDDERPYGSVTEARAGSYWNLVLPYALASGLFAPGSHEADGVLRYLLGHGSRMLGLVRAGAYSLYGRDAAHPTSGVNPVYGVNAARFLADNDRPDQLVLSLYGQLAVGMTPGTFVSGEAASVSPLRGEYYRSTYLPPNAASNASFLETLRLMLVHETRGPTGAPNGLELAFATPRAWLEPGKRIAVDDLPTSFGPVSFAITRFEDRVRVRVEVPGRERIRSLNLRLRLPRGDRVLRATLDGRRLRVGGDGETLDLSGRRGALFLEAVVARAPMR